LRYWGKPYILSQNDYGYKQKITYEYEIKLQAQEPPRSKLEAPGLKAQVSAQELQTQEMLE